MAALSAFRQGVDHRGALPVTYQDHFPVLLLPRRSFLNPSLLLLFYSTTCPFLLAPLLHSCRAQRHLLSFVVGRSTFRPFRPVPAVLSTLRFQPSLLFFFFLLLLLLLFSFSAGSTSPHLRQWIDSSDASFSSLRRHLPRVTLFFSDSRSILLTKMCTEKLLVNAKSHKVAFREKDQDPSNRSVLSQCFLTTRYRFAALKSCCSHGAI